MGALLLAAMAAYGQQSVGGGISVFIPQSLYGEGEGSVSIESSLETSLGLGEYIKVPIGVSYNQIYGLTPVDAGVQADRPWLYADSLMAHAGLGVRIPLGVMNVQLFGAGAGNWNANYYPLTKNIEEDLAGSDQVGNADHVSFSSLDVEAPFGLGWIVGGSVGATFGDIGVDISVSYRHILHDLSIKGDYQAISGDTATSDTYESRGGLDALLSGFAFGVGGSFSF